MYQMHDSWSPIKKTLYQEPLLSFNDHLGNISFQPGKDDIFNVFQMPLKKVKVVILGQDPYPKPGDAIGYSFATRENRSMPKSLQIIRNEINQEKDLEVHPDYDGWQTLKHWRDQGVFLLNTALTVETGRAGSHLKQWNDFTINTIKFLSHFNPSIWILWGRKAQNFTPYISNKFNASKYSREQIVDIPIVPTNNYVIKAPHPAAEAYAGGNAGFYGSDCFYQANRVLSSLKSPVINW